MYQNMLTHPTIAVALSPELDPIWRNCHKLGHKMKVHSTLPRIFPTLGYNITGLDPESSYRISLHLDSKDNKKLRGEELDDRVKMDSSRKVWHCKKSQTGEKWMERTVSFAYIRITSMKSLEESNSDLIYCPAGYWYSPVLTIYKDDMPIHTSCILHTHFKTVNNIQSEELKNYKNSLKEYAKANFIKKREADSEMQPPAKKPRSMALPSSSISGVPTLPPNMNFPSMLGGVPAVPPTMNPFLFNMPLLRYENPFFWNPMGVNLLTNVFHSPSITPSTDSATPDDKATDDDDEEDEEINVTDL